MAVELLKLDSFINQLIENKDNLKNKIPFIGSIRFRDDNFKYAINKADLLNVHINKQGNLDLLVADLYDFDEPGNNDLLRLGHERQLQVKLFRILLYIML